MAWRGSRWGMQVVVTGMPIAVLFVRLLHHASGYSRPAVTTVLPTCHVDLPLGSCSFNSSSSQLLSYRTCYVVC